jgi:hypothetical protein
MKYLLSCMAIPFLFITSCNHHEASPHCQISATVKDFSGIGGCGFVFVLDDGTKLEPYRVMMCGTPPLPKEVTDDPLFNFQFADGKRVKINYEKMEGMASTCMVGDIVKITCIADVGLIEK